MTEQIVLKKLNKEQKLEYEDINGFYKFYYECPSCKRIYGADEEEKNLFCPKCISEIKRKTRKGLNS